MILEGRIISMESYLVGDKWQSWLGRFLVASVAMAAWSCVKREPAVTERIVAQALMTTDGIVLKDWLVLGPEWYADREMAFDDDALARFGGGETMRAEEFFSLARAGRDGISGRRLVRGDGKVDLRVALGMRSVQSGEGAVYYAGCLVRSVERRTVYSLIGNDDWIKIIVNGRTIDASKRNHDGAHPSYVVPLELKAGDNFLLLKIVNLGGGTGFTMSLEAERDRALLKSARQVHTFLQNIFVSRGQNPVLNFPIATECDRFQVEIAGLATGLEPERVDYVNRAATENRSRSMGLYSLKLRIGSESVSNLFLVGEPGEYARELSRRRAAAQMDERASLQLDGLFRRLDLMLAPKNRKAGDTNWELNVVDTMAAVEQILARCESGQAPLKNLGGVHLRSFRSRIDDQVQHYRIYAPADLDASDTSRPLFVVFPTAISASRPFIESPFMAAHLAAINIGRHADTTGALVVWPGYRNQPSGSRCELTHLDEVLRDLERDYRIDQERIVLIGVCSGGFLAAMAVVEWPDRFAAIGIHDAIMHRFVHAHLEYDTFRRFPDYHEWLAMSDPLPPLLSLGKGCPPIYLTNDNPSPGHGEWELSVAFKDRATSAGVEVNLDRIPETYGRTEEWQILFEKTSRHTRRHPVAIAETERWRRNSANTIADFFSEKFILVVPTLGPNAQLVAAGRIARSFQDAWATVHYGNCVMKKDTELTENELKHVNLLLLGNESANAVWASLRDQLPVRLAQDRVDVRGASWSGENLSIQALFPKPVGEGKVLLMGAADLEKARLGLLNISVTGWFETAVYSASDKGIGLVSAKGMRHAGDTP